MNGSGTIWTSVLEQFERHAPASVMARVALEHALPSEWIDMVFEEHRQRQYSRELLFSTVIELVTLVSLGLRPSLHAAARSMESLPVSMGALYDKVNRTEPAILRALVRGSAERLRPIAAEWSRGPSLPGWQLRVLDGNHLPASEKRLAPLRGHRGAALPGHTLVVYDAYSDETSHRFRSKPAACSEANQPGIPMMPAGVAVGFADGFIELGGRVARQV
jgi:IS4 transposase